MSVSDAFFHRVKAAQRDMIRLAGGIERAAEIANISKSHMGRMNNPSDGELMTLSVVVALENDIGQPLVTSVLAEANGRRLTDPEADRKAEANVLTGHAELLRHSAEAAHSMALAIADGHVSPAEASTVDRSLSQLQQATNDLRGMLAGIKARGGDKAALRVVGDSD